MENQHPDFLMGVSENLFITIGKVNIQNFHVTVGGIIPKLNGEFAENMNAKVSTDGVVIGKIGEVRWKRSYLPAPLN